MAMQHKRYCYTTMMMHDETPPKTRGSQQASFYPSYVIKNSHYFVINM